MPNFPTLADLKPGQKATIRRVHGKGPLRRRLMDMGLVRGLEVELLKTAPFGDPLEYKVRDYHLSLRRSEAELVEINA